MSRIVTALLAALIWLPPSGASAHEVPNDVTIQLFLKPDGQRMRLLVRVPLAALQDIDYPRRGAGLLDLARADAALRDATTMWIADNVAIDEGETRVGYPRVVFARASIPSDRSFSSYEAALGHVMGPRLPVDTEFIWNQGMLDALLEYPIQSDRSQFALRPAFGRLGVRVVTVLRFLPPGGAVRAFEIAGDPGLVRLDPRWHQAALRFVEAGFFHILDGTDHLLFLLCLVIPFRRFRSLVVIVTSFTVAHSITLIASAYGLGPDALWFPPLIETLIAMSIVYMALENVVLVAGGAAAPPAQARAPGPQMLDGARVRRRWLITFAFGLVHGFGFSFALRQTLQFAGSHLLTSLLSFNIGVELGQMLVLALLVPLLQVLFRFAVAERPGTIILSALVAHTGWHWMLERGDRLRQFRLQWPVMDAAFLASATRWLMLALLGAAVLWIVFGVLRSQHDVSASRRTRSRSG